jgi:hypothetical protein
MFDNLREDANSSSLYEEKAKFIPAAGTTSDPAMRKRQFLGLKPFQRFFLAALLLIAVCTLGMACLLLTGKLGLFL